MSQNSNPSNNSPASTHQGSPTTTTITAVNEDVNFTTTLLNEFNAWQERHISVLSSAPLVQYVPSSPSPSVQEVALPPPLHIHFNPKGPHPPMSPSTAKTILRMVEDREDLNTTACTVAYGLATTICRQTNMANQHLEEACICINQLNGVVQQ